MLMLYDCIGTWEKILLSKNWVSTGHDTAVKVLNFFQITWGTCNLNYRHLLLYRLLTVIN